MEDGGRVFDADYSFEAEGFQKGRNKRRSFLPGGESEVTGIHGGESLEEMPRGCFQIWLACWRIDGVHSIHLRSSW